MNLHRALPQEAYHDTEVESERKNKQLAKRMIDIKSKIHNKILDFYKVITAENPDEDVVEGLPASLIPNEDMKFEFVAGMICKGIKESPHLSVPVSTNFNSKFILVHEVIKFLHDYLSTSLMIRHNYYESLVQKTDDLSQFYQSTVSRKKDLHSQNHDITVQMLDYQDQISKIDSQLEDIEASIANNQQKIKQQEEIQRELQKMVGKKDKRIKKIVSMIEQITGSEYDYVLHKIQYGTSEDFLIKTLGQIINEDVEGFASRQEFEILFMNSSHL
jgi:hypothetical protein